MKKLKTLSAYTLILMLLVAGLTVSSMFYSDANAQQAEPQYIEPEPCGLCVKPNESYPYPDASSSYETTGCTACD